MKVVYSRYLECYLKICYIHGALQCGYATIRNAHATIQKTTFFELGVYIDFGSTSLQHTRLI